MGSACLLYLAPCLHYTPWFLACLSPSPPGAAACPLAAPTYFLCPSILFCLTCCHWTIPYLPRTGHAAVRTLQALRQNHLRRRRYASNQRRTAFLTLARDTITYMHGVLFRAALTYPHFYSVHTMRAGWTRTLPRAQCVLQDCHFSPAREPTARTFATYVCCASPGRGGWCLPLFLPRSGIPRRTMHAAFTA